MSSSIRDLCPLISVVVPVYNVVEYLDDCFDSLLSQLYKNIEVVLVDDGSTDSSGEVCDRRAAEDSRFKVVHQDNRGLSSARNKGTVERGRDDYLVGDKCGVYIDIFLVEDVPDCMVARWVHGFVSLGLGFALSCRRFLQYEDAYLSLVEGGFKAKRVFRLKACLGRLLSFRSMDAWCRAWDKWNGLCRNDSSRYVSVPVGRAHYFTETWRQEDVFPTKKMPFGDGQISVPAQPKIYLKALYGLNYMTPPPVEERETHVVYELDLGECR